MNFVEDNTVPMNFVGDSSASMNFMEDSTNTMNVIEWYADLMNFMEVSPDIMLLQKTFLALFIFCGVFFITKPFVDSLLLPLNVSHVIHI